MQTDNTCPSKCLFTPPKLYDGHRWRNMRIGLFGGSFNPPHDAHVKISDFSLRKLGLDCVWWLVTPQNPTKSRTSLMPFKERMHACRQLVTNPRIVVSDLENRLGSTNTLEAVIHIKRMYPESGFIWIGGMDLAHQMPQWQSWHRLINEIAFAFFARPPSSTLVRHSSLGMQACIRHYTLNKSHKVTLKPGNIYWILQSRMMDMSSTAIRNYAYYQ